MKPIAGKLPTREPADAREAGEDLDLWPCIVASGAATTFASLTKQAADPAEKAAFAARIKANDFRNLGDFDIERLQIVGAASLHSWRIGLLPHRTSQIAIPFFIGAEDLRLLARE